MNIFKINLISMYKLNDFIEKIFSNKKIINYR